MGVIVTEMLVELKVRVRGLSLYQISQSLTHPYQNALIYPSLHPACLVRPLGFGPKYRLVEWEKAE